MACVQSNSITLSASRRKKALLIAVQDNMKNNLKLYHVWRDAEALKRLLIDVFGYSAEDIVLMKDSKSVSDEFWPTKKRIREQIRCFVRDVSPGDHLFFYYSGHGHQVPCHHHTESDGLEEVMCSCDGKEIMDNDLKKWLVEPLPPGCKLFALWDSCHSQTMLDLEHTICNEPESEQQTWQRRESGSPSPSPFERALPKCLRRHGNIQRSPITIAPHVLRGRPVVRASISITAVSAGNSPLSKWVPFSVDIPRVLSPPSWFKCNGKCPLPGEGEAKAYVISLSACKDDQSAFDDACNGTFTKFFIDHLRLKPKSTLLELLLAMRRCVDKITAARQALDENTDVISRRSTFASDRRVETEWIPYTVRRGTEVVAGTPEELFRLSSAREKNKRHTKYSQIPSYASQYRLNLDELVDL